MALSTRRYIEALNVAFRSMQRQDTLDFYSSKLDRWQEDKQFPEERWVSAVDKMVEELQYFPDLATVMQYVAKPARDPRWDRNRDFWLFTLDGKRYAVPVMDWTQPTRLPLAATETHACVSKPWTGEDTDASPDQDPAETDRQ